MVAHDEAVGIESMTRAIVSRKAELGEGNVELGV